MKYKTIKSWIISLSVLIILSSVILFITNKGILADDRLWTVSGTCEWNVIEGTLIIRPFNGVSGILESYETEAPGWQTFRDEIKKVVVEDGVKTNAGCYNLFGKLNKCTEMNISKLDTSLATNMEFMFQDCTNLTTLDVSNLNTSNVTSMRYMFLNTKIKLLDLSNFNTSKVTDMSGMFANSKEIEDINLSGLDTSNVVTMNNMFQHCHSLTSIDVANWNVSNVIDMEGLFHDSGIVSMDLSNWQPKKVTTVTSMFTYCGDLTTVTFGDNWRMTNNLKTMDGLFQCCTNLVNINSPNFNTTNVIDMTSSFNLCSALKEIDLSEWNTSSCISMMYMFSGCESIEQIDLSNFDTSQVTTMEQMFCENESLITLDLLNFDTTKVTNMNEMFVGCKKLTNLNLSSFNTNNCYTMIDMLYRCNNLKTINLGENFHFNGDFEAYGQQLPDIPSDKYYTGSWIREDLAYGPFTPDEMIYNFDGATMAGVWIWERRGYNVSYSYTGEIPENASALPEKQTYQYDEEIVLPENATASGYIFSGWNTDYITMPAEDIEITGYFIKEDLSKEYKIEYYFDGEKDDSLSEDFNGEIDKEVIINPLASLKNKGIQYTLASKEHKITISENAEDNVIRVYYETDILDYNDTKSTEGDGIPDKYQIRITYKVENGTWDDDTLETKIEIITLYDKNGNLAENGRGETNIPDVGNKPSEGYKKGSWKRKIPKQVKNSDNGKEFIYAYAKINNILKINGTIFNPKTDDIIDRYLIQGGAAIIVMLTIIVVRNKYSRKKRNIQF